MSDLKNNVNGKQHFVETIGFLIAFSRNLTPFLYPTGRQKI